MRKFISGLFLIGFSFLISCSGSGTHYYINEPADVAVIENAFKCEDGTLSYAAFVVNNDNGGRVVLINGCEGSVLKSFKGFDGDTGVYTGEDPSSVRVMLKEDGSYLLITASSTWKRLSLTPINSDFSLVYKESMDEDGNILKIPEQTIIGLDFYPLAMDIYEKAFVVSGYSYEGLGVVKFFDESGVSYSSFSGDFYFSKIICRDTLCYAVDNKTGSLFTFTSGTEPVKQVLGSDSIDNAGFKGVLLLSKNRLVVWNEHSFFLLDENLVSKELFFPFKWQIENVFAVSYKDRKYLPVTRDHFEDTIDIKPQDYADNDVILYDDEYETDDSDVVYEFKKAEEAETLWLSSSTGRIFAYNLTDDLWMISNTGFAPYSYLSSYKNIDKIKSFKAKRYYYHSVYYRIGWEESYKNSVSTTGVLTENSIADECGYFLKYSTTSVNGGDRVLLLPKESGEGSNCFSADKDLRFDILSVDSNSVINVDFAGMNDEIQNCYGDSLSYALFPNNAYNVKKTEWNYAYSEIPARPSEQLPDSYLYKDDYIDIELYPTDNDSTSDNSYLTFKLKFYTPYIGYNTTIYYSKAFMLSSGNVLLFSPSDQLLLEYNPNDDSQINIYR